MTLPTTIALENVSVKYNTLVALDHVTVQIHPQTMCAIIGPNGGGKSTLLKALMGMVKLSSGKIHVSRDLRKKIAYLPQQSQVDRSFPVSVYDVVAMGMWGEIGPFRSYPKNAGERIMHVLEEVGMAAHSERPIGTLSGGQLQRVLFARLSLQNAAVVLLDEPFNNLDQPTIEDLIAMLMKWHAEGRTVLAVLHDLDLVRQYFPECILLARKVLGYGQTDKVMSRENLINSFSLARHWTDGSEHG